MSEIFYTNCKKINNVNKFDQIYEIDGNICVDSKSLFIHFGNILKFPKYFGNNWDAFNDCIGDLSWLGVGNILIVVNNINGLLILEKNQISTFFEIIFETVIYNNNTAVQKHTFEEPNCSFVFCSEKSEFKDLIIISKKYSSICSINKLF